MKVILLKDVPRVGRKNEIKEVAPGFGRTVLIARQQAVLVTPAALETARRRQAIEIKKFSKEHDLAARAAELLTGSTITLKARANVAGQLFAALHEINVAAAIKKERGIELQPEAIKLKQPLKSLGFHHGTVDLGEQVVAFTILIEPLSA